MCKTAARLAIALLAFSIGIGVHDLWVNLRSQQATRMLPATPSVAEALPAGPLESWQKIEAEGKFSFSLPPHMEERSPTHPGLDRVFIRRRTAEDQYLYLAYGYDRRGACGRDAGFSGAGVSQKSEVMIGGKSAKLNIWQPEPGRINSSLSQLPKMTLCFPDVSHGKASLYFFATARELETLEMARQIFDTIEFH